MTTQTNTIAKHTQGDWKTKLTNATCDVWAETKDHETLVVVCSKSKEGIANAQLIASAPWLLAVLKEILIQNQMGLNTVESTLIIEATKAIAQAEGVQS